MEGTEKSVVKTIVDVILAKLNITERGKIENFFMKQRSELNRELRDLNKNKKTLSDEHQDFLDDMTEKLQDAKSDVEEAYSDVTIENLVSNESAKAFGTSYWNRIEVAERAVAKLEAQVKSATTLYSSELEKIEAEIKERQRRLNKIS